jgi:hypothetical protein
MAHRHFPRHRHLLQRQPHSNLEPLMPSTSWQWDPDTKQATCCYCGFTTAFAGDSPGQIDHECDSAKHPAHTARQGLPIGRSPKPGLHSRHLSNAFSCLHRGSELRQQRCETCGSNVRIKVFACAIHIECQLDERIAGVKYCGRCDDRSNFGRL